MRIRDRECECCEELEPGLRTRFRWWRGKRKRAKVYGSSSTSYNYTQIIRDPFEITTLDPDVSVFTQLMKKLPQAVDPLRIEWLEDDFIPTISTSIETARLERSGLWSNWEWVG